jgi:hypothetical protein
VHGDLTEPFDVWYRVAKRASWRWLQDVRAVFRVRIVLTLLIEDFEEKHYALPQAAQREVPCFSGGVLFGKAAQFLQPSIAAGVFVFALFWAQMRLARELWDRSKRYWASSFQAQGWCWRGVVEAVARRRARR